MKKSSIFEDDLSRYLSEALILEETGVTWSFRLAMFGSLLIFALAMLVASTLKMNEAVVAQGQFRPQSYAHEIQPSENGIIDEILIKEGDIVKEGEVLLRLKNSITTSNQEQMEGRMAGLMARSARLVAYLNGTQADFSSIEARYQDVIRDQTTLLVTQNLSRQASYWVFDTQITQKKVEVDQAEGEIKNSENRVKVNRSLLALQERLAQKNLASRMTLLEAKRALLTIEGELGALKIKRDKAKFSLQEVSLKRVAFDNDLNEQTYRELGVVQNEINLTQNALAGLGDRQKHLEIIAPAPGRIQNMRYRTLGSVIGAGETVLQIIPEHDELTLELNIPTKDIGYVHPGQSVNIKINGFDVNRFGSVDGTLTSISPFTHMDVDKQMYYKGIVQTLSRSIGHAEQKFPIFSGMWADAEIITGHRSMLEYLLKPLLAPMTH